MQPPADWSRARVTLGLAAAAAAVWAIVALFQLRGWAIGWGAFVPADLTMDFVGPRAPFWLTPLTATMLHADIFHLLLNLLVLAICGRAVENVLGPWSLAILFVLGAYVAAGAHYLVHPDELRPMIGASGAVSAVLGAYAMLFGRNKVKVGNPRLALWLNALWLAAAWIFLNLLIAYAAAATLDIGIAFAAHIGGFAVGLLLVYPLLLLRYRKA